MIFFSAVTQMDPSKFSLQYLSKRRQMLRFPSKERFCKKSNYCSEWNTRPVNQQAMQTEKCSKVGLCCRVTVWSLNNCGFEYSGGKLNTSDPDFT